MGAAKWIGGIIGFMAGGPLGALAGFVFGSLFDTDSSDAGSYYGEEPTHGTTYTGQRNSFLFVHARDGFVHYPCRRAHHA